MDKITGVMEIRCDGQEDDKIDEFFTLVCMTTEGKQVEVSFTLAGAKSVRESFDAIPEIDRE